MTLNVAPAVLVKSRVPSCNSSFCHRLRAGQANTDALPFVDLPHQPQTNKHAANLDQLQSSLCASVSSVTDKELQALGGEETQSRADKRGMCLQEAGVCALGGKKLFTWNRGLWDNSPWHVGSCGGLEGLGLKSV